MSQISQPSVTADWVRAFGSFDARHGWLVNAVVVVALAGIGACFLTARPSLVRAGVIAGSVLCLADWVLVQDFGFLGGLGTDPNSMLPMIVVFTSGYLALVRLPVRAAASAAAPVEPAPPVADRVLAGAAPWTGESEGAVPDGPAGPRRPRRDSGWWASIPPICSGPSPRSAPSPSSS